MELRRVIGVIVNLPVGALSFVKLGASITAWNRPRNPAYTGYRRTGRDDRYHADAQIYPALGQYRLQPETIRRWQADLVKSADRRWPGAGEP
jgi:hypothetical protein